MIEITDKLLLAVCIIFLTVPYFQLDYILLTKIIDYNISSGLISGLCFDVVVACTVDNGLQEKQELLASVFLFEFFFKRSEYLRISLDKKLFSLAFYPKNSALPAPANNYELCIMNYLSALMPLT